MSPHEKHTLERIAASLRQGFADRIVAFYAFGSRVRGTHHAWSDFDVLIVVRDRDSEAEAEIVGLVVDEEIKAGLPFAAVIKDARVCTGESTA
jgi:predicted nucleotidyltransferase